MTTKTNQALIDQVQAHAEGLERAGRYAREGLADVEEYGDEVRDLVQVVNEDVLEVLMTRTLGQDGPPRSFTLVVGTGGPHVEVEVYDSTSAEWRGYWASERYECERYDDVYPELFELLAEIGDYS